MEVVVAHWAFLWEMPPMLSLLPQSPFLWWVLGYYYLYASHFLCCFHDWLSSGIRSSAAENLLCPERKSRRDSLEGSDKQISELKHNFYSESFPKMHMTSLLKNKTKNRYYLSLLWSLWVGEQLLEWVLGEGSKLWKGEFCQKAASSFENWERKVQPWKALLLLLRCLLCSLSSFA